MTIVNATTVFGRHDFTEMVEEWSSKFVDKEFMSYVSESLKNIDYVEGVDYGQVLKIRKQQMNRFKANSNGFGGNGTNWFGK
jgi:hypothetical protein